MINYPNMKFQLELNWFILIVVVSAVVSCESHTREKAKSLPLNRKGELVQLEENRRIIPADPIDSVARIFIWFDQYSGEGSFVLEEPDIYDWFNSNSSETSKEYLPLILERYPLGFYYETLIKCYLHRAGDEEPLAEVIARKSDLSEDDRKWLEFLLQHSLGNN